MRGTARLAHSQNPPPPTISDFSDRLLGWTAFVPPAALSFQRNRIFACHTTWQSLLRMLMVGVAEVGGIDIVKYYAHTAVSPDGTNDPNEERWQLLSTHLSNVASLAKQFAAPLNLTEEAGLAGFLHDL
jgi:hypothetical protein